MDVLGFQFKIDHLEEKNDVAHLRGIGAAYCLDRQGDVIRPGAFKRTLEERAGEPLPMLWSHDASQPIGRWIEAKETDEGLAVAGELILSVRRAAEVRDLMRAGIVRGLSIGYHVPPGGAREGKDCRELVDIDLWEVSACVFAANPRATITAAPKALGSMAPADWNQFFRSAGFSRSETEKLTWAVRTGLQKRAAEEVSDVAEHTALNELLTVLRMRSF